jgi:hypothetical protein
MSEANHEEHRADDPPGEDGQGQPPPLTAPESGLATRARAKRAYQSAHRHQTKARTEIEQPRQHPRIDIPQKQLGKGGAGAEEKGRQNGEIGTRETRVDRSHSLYDPRAHRCELSIPVPQKSISRPSKCFGRI